MSNEHEENNQPVSIDNKNKNEDTVNTPTVPPSHSNISAESHQSDTIDTNSNSINTNKYESHSLNTNNSLARLNFIGGTKLDTAFDKDTYNYTATLPSSQNSVGFGASFDSSTTTAVVDNVKSTMDVYWNNELKKAGLTILSGFSIPYTDDAENIMKIVVTAENGDKATYTISFNRIKYSNTDLSRLNFIGGTKLDTAFDKDTYNYTATIPSSQNSVGFGASFDGSTTTAVVDNVKSTMDVYWNDELKKTGLTMLNNFSIPYVDDKENIMKIVVTAENGDTATYTISFHRPRYKDTSLVRLNFLGDTKLNETFDKNKYDYTATLPSHQHSVGFGASFDSSSTTAVNSNNATMDVYWNGELKKTGLTMLCNFSIPYIDDEDNIMEIVVTAENGDTATYTIEFNRVKHSNTDLSRLNFFGGTQLNEAFNKDTYDYTATLPSSQHSVSFGAAFDSSTTTAVVNNTKSTMDVYWNDELKKTGLTILSGFSIPYTDDAENVMKIVVTAENGDTATYTISFNRIKYSNADLSRLNFINGVTLDTPFARNIFDYTATLDSNNNVVKFGASFDGSTTTAVVNNVKSTMDVYWNGKLEKENIELLSNTSFALEPQSTNVLKIVVTAENGDTQTYTITFARKLDSNTTIKDLVIKDSLIEFIDDTYIATMNKWSGISIDSIITEDSWAQSKILSQDKEEISPNTIFDLGTGDNNELNIEITSNNGTVKVYPIKFERVDKIKPSVQSTTSTDDWTNKSVTINIEASDDSGIKYIELSNGDTIENDTIKYNIDNNGVYEFKVYDNFLNETIHTVAVNNIDTEAPVLDFDISTTEITNSSVDISLKAQDNIGIKYIQTPDNNIITDNQYTFTASKDGEYTFTVSDLAGNITSKTIVINNIASQKPSVITEISNKHWTKDNISIKISASSEKGIKSITLPNGDIINDSTATFTVNQNGVYTIKVESIGGNTSVENIKITNIDKQLPTLELKNSGGNIFINAKDDSGIQYIILPTGEKIYDSSYTYEANTIGTFTFTAVDLAGNKVNKSISIHTIESNTTEALTKQNKDNTSDSKEQVNTINDNIKHNVDVTNHTKTTKYIYIICLLVTIAMATYIHYARGKK